MRGDGAFLAKLTCSLTEDGVLQRAELLHVLLELFLRCVPTDIADEQSGLVLRIGCLSIKFASFFRCLSLLLLLLGLLFTVLLRPGVKLRLSIFLLFLFAFFLPLFKANRERFDKLLSFHIRVLL